jgi:hypothetical protein
VFGLIAVAGITPRPERPPCPERNAEHARDLVITCVVAIVLAALARFALAATIPNNCAQYHGYAGPQSYLNWQLLEQKHLGLVNCLQQQRAMRALFPRAGAPKLSEGN